ncbi:hypothetical protein TNCV_2036351 [Trichonephila clavipes]|nr:hypothetical protein TNCV_2036351 [Trichonephila clavipes]
MHNCLDGSMGLGNVFMRHNMIYHPNRAISVTSENYGIVIVDKVPFSMAIANMIMHHKVWKKEVSLQEALDLLQNLPSETSDVLTDDFSDEEVPENNLLEVSLDS